MKKILALATAVAMTACMSVTAFAATGIDIQDSVEDVQVDTLDKTTGTDYFIDNDDYDGTAADPTNVWANGQIVEEVKVTAVVAPEFTITIPKEIVMDGSTKEADYTVNVVGDIAGDQTITVTPDASFELNEDGGKDPVTCTVTQADTGFNSDEIAADGGKTVDGNLSAQDLTAGNWSGKYNFTIVYQ